MAVDPFEDDPIAEAEIVPPEWRRQARAARESLRRVRQTQNARRRRGLPPLEDDEPEGAAVGGGPAADRAGIAGGSEVLQNILEKAEQIRELLQTISEKLPSVGTYGP